jgi:hypothetical protein
MTLLERKHPVDNTVKEPLGGRPKHITKADLL